HSILIYLCVRNYRESFTLLVKYGLTIFVTTDLVLSNYLKNVVDQLKDWLSNHSMQRIVMVINSIKASEVLKIWQFDIEQIIATVTFLPLLEAACSFDLLISTDKEDAKSAISNARIIINNSKEVRLRSFTTTIHKVNSMVAFKKIDFF
uniref:HORMA domain-containing protein n=1 Tax=Callorhinchus milii TaxID=7868 RepID=A0A4W3HUM4_CALMI